MFDWFWEFLYGISKSLFRLIDGLMACANMLCGIEPITVDDVEVDFLNYLVTHDRIMLAFEAATIIGVVLVGLFAIFAIIKSIVSEKAGMTPGQVFVKTFKTIFMFMFVPACMIAFIYFSNTIMQTLYRATMGSTSDGVGRFLCGAFSQDAVKPSVSPNFYLDPNFDYTSTSQVWKYIDISDFDFLFSWIAGICILIALGQALLMFVDRAISLVILFIVSPVSMSTSVIDDGAHFKLWRDQVFVKFLTGYGCILGLNVYILIVSIITNNSVVFFTSGFLNNLMKIAFIIGGAVSMQRIMALIGNLVQAGAGSGELRDNAIANAGFKSALGSIGRAAAAPFRGIKSAANFAKDAKEYGTGTAIGSALGFKTGKDYGARSESQKQAYQEKLQQKADFAKKNAEQPSLANQVKMAISGENGGNKSNENHNPVQQNGNQALGNAINASLSGKSHDDSGISGSRPHI